MLNGAILLISPLGRVRNTTSAPVAKEVNGAVGFNKGLLSVDINTPQRWANGLPFTSTGRLCCQTGGAIVSHSNGVPINEFGCVAVDTVAPVSRGVGGVPFTSAGRIAFAASETPVVTSEFSDAFALLEFN